MTLFKLYDQIIKEGNILNTWLEYVNLWIGDLIINFSLYFIIATLAFFVVWKWYETRLKNVRIQDKKKATENQIKTEILRSMRTLLIFASMDVFVLYLQKNGFTQIYNDLDDFGMLYFFCSIILMLLIHDTYFYWIHRLMHQKVLFKYVHKVHHESIDTTPFSAFSFHTIEAILEYGITPLLVFIMPTHILGLFIFQLLMTSFNVIGHLGYELYPKKWHRIPIIQWKTTSVHHNLHHSKFNGNYGLYFTWWDKLFNTEFQETRDKFEQITNRQSTDFSVASKELR